MIKRIKIPQSRLDVQNDTISELNERSNEWEKDTNVTECYLCGKEFGIFTRKHHCRNCGKIMCSDCLQEYKNKKNFDVPSVKVCKLCYNCVLNLEGKNSNDCKKYMSGANLIDDSVKQFISEDFDIDGKKVSVGNILTIIRNPNIDTLKTIFKARVDDLNHINPNISMESDETSDGGIKLTITEIVDDRVHDFKVSDKVYLVSLAEGNEELVGNPPSRILIKKTLKNRDGTSKSEGQGLSIVSEIADGTQDNSDIGSGIGVGGYKRRKKSRNKHSSRRRVSKRFNIRRKNKKITKRLRKSRRHTRR